MKNATIPVALGSGREGWLTIEFGSLSFVLEIEGRNGKTSRETLSVDELKTRLPNVANVVAEILAQGVRTST